MRKRLDRTFTRIASWIAAATGQPLAFILAFSVVLVWAVSGPMFAFSETWQLVINTGTTIVTFLMVFLIQNSQNRDTASIQAKLDELLYALDGARDEFIGIEHLAESEIIKIRDALEQEAKAGQTGKSPEKARKVDRSVDALIKRL